MIILSDIFEINFLLKMCMSVALSQWMTWIQIKQQQNSTTRQNFVFLISGKIDWFSKSYLTDIHVFQRYLKIAGRDLLATTSVLATVSLFLFLAPDIPSHLFLHIVFCTFSFYVLLSRKNVISDTILSLCFSFIYMYMCVLFCGVSFFWSLFLFSYTLDLLCSFSLPLQTGVRSSHRESSHFGAVTPVFPIVCNPSPPPMMFHPLAMNKKAVYCPISWFSSSSTAAAVSTTISVTPGSIVLAIRQLQFFVRDLLFRSFLRLPIFLCLSSSNYSYNFRWIYHD